MPSLESAAPVIGNSHILVHELNNELHQPAKNIITNCMQSVVISTRSLPFVQLSRKVYNLRNASFICITSVRNIFRAETCFAKYTIDACRMKKTSRVKCPFCPSLTELQNIKCHAHQVDGSAAASCANMGRF
jgi:hypothetical protein